VRVVTHRVSGPLGDWTAVVCEPPALAGLVARLWHFDGVVAHPRERVLPSGHLEIVVQLRGRYGLVRDRGVDRCTAVGVSGVQAAPFVIEAPADRAIVVGIELTPDGAWQVLGRPLHEVAGPDHALDAVVGGAADALADACAAAPSPDACLRAAADWCRARILRTTPVDAPIAWVARTIRHHRGAVAIADLRDAAGFTTARLATQFREQIGVTPKVYARIHRFRHALDRLRAGGSSIADVAAAAGYYDQAHLTAECRALAGLTPTALLAGTRYETGINVPER
jgi:methylphosphotriester-DNA--protein-cysteine methyltransferase